MLQQDNMVNDINQPVTNMQSGAKGGLAASPMIQNLGSGDVDNASGPDRPTQDKPQPEQKPQTPTEPKKEEPKYNQAESDQKIADNEAALDRLAEIKDNLASGKGKIGAPEMQQFLDADKQKQLMDTFKNKGSYEYKELLNKFIGDKMLELRNENESLRGDKNYDGRSDDQKWEQYWNEWKADREDTAYQRAQSDMQKAGLNPGLMWGGGSAASASGGSSSGRSKRDTERERMDKRRKRRQEQEMQQNQINANMQMMLTMAAMNMVGQVAKGKK